MTWVKGKIYVTIMSKKVNTLFPKGDNMDFTFEINVVLLYFRLLTLTWKQVSNVELMEGDIIVMGSDGLYDNVFDHEIALTVARYRDVSEAGIVFLLDLVSFEELRLTVGLSPIHNSFCC